MNRWWDLYTHRYKALTGALLDLTICGVRWTPAGTHEDQEFKATLVRLSLATHALMFKQLRSGRDERLHELVEARGGEG